MKIDIPEKLYFEIVQSANMRDITPVEHISQMQQLYNDCSRTYENATQQQLDYFIDCLNQTIEEIMESQEDLANSEEGTEVDRKMIEVLNILFGRATRDYMIVSEMLDEFLKE